jgi:hypothetical protein
LFYSRVSARLMFKEGAMSSAQGVREPGVPKTTLLRILGIVAGSLPTWCSECCSPEAVRGSLTEVVLEDGIGSSSSIWQSGGNDGEAWCAWDLPLSEVASRSGVWRLIGVRALSGVRDRSEVLGAGDWPRPVLTNPILFSLAYEERVLSGAFPELPGFEPSPCWLGSAVVGGSCTRATSPTIS